MLTKYAGKWVHDERILEGADAPSFDAGLQRLASRFLWACIRDAYSGRRLAHKRVQAWLQQPEHVALSPYAIGTLLGIRPQLIIRTLQKVLTTPSAYGDVPPPRSLAKFVAWAKRLQDFPDADESSQHS